MTQALHVSVNASPAAPLAAGCGFFAHPRGWTGRLAGLLMARRNAALNQRAVELLDPREDDRVLEVGFGPGVGLQRLTERVRIGMIVGIDSSEVMVRQASARLRPWLDDGRMLLKRASAGALPFGDELFDRALAIDTTAHWPSLGEGLRELARVLKPFGSLVVAAPTAGDATAAWLDAVADEVREAGFRHTTPHSFQWNDAAGAAILARR